MGWEACYKYLDDLNASSGSDILSDETLAENKKKFDRKVWWMRFWRVANILDGVHSYRDFLDSIITRFQVVNEWRSDLYMQKIVDGIKPVSLTLKNRLMHDLVNKAGVDYADAQLKKRGMSLELYRTSGLWNGYRVMYCTLKLLESRITPLKLK